MSDIVNKIVADLKWRLSGAGKEGQAISSDLAEEAELAEALVETYGELLSRSPGKAGLPPAPGTASKY